MSGRGFVKLFSLKRCNFKGFRVCQMKNDAFQDRRLKKSAVFFWPKLGRTGKKGACPRYTDTCNR